MSREILLCPSFLRIACEVVEPHHPVLFRLSFAFAFLWDIAPSALIPLQQHAGGFI